MGNYHYIIIGSGVAGLYAARILGQSGRVLVITKGAVSESNTRYAQGGIASALGPEDSPKEHWKDTMAAGAGLCNPNAVRVLTEEGPEVIRDLMALGLPFDRDEFGPALAREGGHSYARVLHAGGDATGFHIQQTLLHSLPQSVEVLETCLAAEIAVHNRAVQGVRAVDQESGQAKNFCSPVVILATGGAGYLFLQTTNPPGATGEGVAMAYRAGATILDMEFFQFHPTALRRQGSPAFLISEAVRGEGGILRDASGYAFMKDFHPRGELAPRDSVARAIHCRMRETGHDHVYLDVTHIAADVLRRRFPNIDRVCSAWGLDITRDPIPVAPAAHYQMGGVLVNLWGETDLPGLYACGEVACAGAHGANRLASNSLLEGLVFAKRTAERCLATGALASSPQAPLESFELTQATGDLEPSPEWNDLLPSPGEPLSAEQIRHLLWEQVGIVRSRDSLQLARRELSRSGPGAAEGQDGSSSAAEMVQRRTLSLVARMMVEAALLRCESRGSHYRLDYPLPSPQWEGAHILFRAGTGIAVGCHKEFSHV